MVKPTSLNQVREKQRFLGAVDYVIRSARGIKKITSSELAQLNKLLTESTDDPWRFSEAEVEIPSGQKHLISVILNPVTRARDLLGAATERAGNGEAREAASSLYSELVLSHLFRVANRRTAVLAALWILEAGGIHVDAEELLKIPVGDLRQKADLDTFIERLERFFQTQKP